MTDATPLKIDIVSDVVCPWCVIGYKQLEAALVQLGDEVHAEISWHPFELNRDMPPEGQDIGEHIAQKYGSTEEQSAANRERLSKLGEELSFPFTYSDDMRIYNTFQAHQLLHWAGEDYGNAEQTSLQLAFFAAYFQDNRDVSDEEVLIELVEETGLDGDKAREVLNDPDQAARVRAMLNFWIEQGVTGVPAIIFDEKYMVPGAQDTETFVNVIRKVSEKKAAA